MASDIERKVAAADSAKGAQLSNVCLACHASSRDAANKLGPNLYNVVGRKIAAMDNYNYSKAMVGTAGTWDLQTLDQFLAAPMKMISGTNMTYPGVKDADDRAALLAWLRLQSDKPMALPKLSVQEKALPGGKPSKEDPNLALLPKGAGREKVFYTCSVCHSIKLVVQQGLSRESWKETLDWMTEEQAMDALDAESELIILDYLSTHFGIPN